MLAQCAALAVLIAHTGAIIQGQQIKRKGIQKYVVPVKEYGRWQRRHSSFYVGLYGQSWVTFKDNCIELVVKLMRLNRNKQLLLSKSHKCYEAYRIYV